MKKLLILFALFSLFRSCATAQNPPDWMTVTAANIHGGGNALLTAGSLTFTATDSQGNLISYQAGGGGQTVQFPTVCAVVNGAIVGQCLLANVSVSNPSNFCYSATITDNNNRTILGGPTSGYQCTQPQTTNFWCATSSCNFDKYVPNLPAAVTALMPPPTALALGGVYAASCGVGLVQTGNGADGNPVCGSAIGTGNVVGSGLTGNVPLVGAGGNNIAIDTANLIALTGLDISVGNLVVGLRGKVLPALAAGYLNYNGSSWLFTNPFASPSLTGTVAISGLADGCLNLTSSIVGTQTCGGGANSFQVNGSPLISSGTVNFANSAAFNGLTFTFIPGAGTIQLGASGQLTPAGLQFSSTSVNGQNCALGGTCTLPFQTNGANNISQAGENRVTSTTNAIGLTATPINTTTNQSKIEIGGQLTPTGLQFSSTSVNGQACALGGACNVPFLTGGSSNASQLGVNFVASSTNAVGLTATHINSGNQERVEIGGQLSVAGLQFPSTNVNGSTCTLGATCTPPATGITPSGSNGTFWGISSGVQQWLVPAGAGNVTGPGASTAGHFAFFSNGSGTLLSDGGLPGPLALQATGGLATGIAKINNGTGLLSTASIGDFPTLNQNTTGSSATAAALGTTGVNGSFWGVSGGVQGYYTPPGGGNVSGSSLTNNIPLIGAGSSNVQTDASHLVARTGVDISTVDQIISTHLAAALPVSQGGIGVTSIGATGIVMSVGGTSVQVDAPVISVEVYGTGSDGGAKISSVINNSTYCPSNGCIVDGRSMSGGDLLLKTNMFHGVNRPVVFLGPMKTLIACVPQVGAQSGDVLLGAKGSSAVNSGFVMRAGTTGDGCPSNFPGGTSTVTFPWQHGPYPAGTYAAIYNACGNSSTDSPVATADCFGDLVLNMQFDGNGLADFDYYSCCVEERGGIYNVPLRGFMKGGAFFDRMFQVGPPGPGGSGPTHFALVDTTAVPYTVSPPADNSFYGYIHEGNTNLITFSGQSGCGTPTGVPKATGQPTAYVLTPGGTPQASGTVTNGGSCTTPPTGCTLNAASGSGASCSLTTNATSVLTISFTCTGGCVGSYPTAQVPDGGFRISRSTVLAPTCTNRFASAVWMEGVYNPHVEDVHTQDVAGDVVTYGAGTAPSSGGLFQNLDATVCNAIGNGAVVHFGLGQQTTGYTAEAVQRLISAGVVIQDDNVGTAGQTLSTTDTPSHAVVPFYTRGSIYAGDFSADTLNLGSASGAIGTISVANASGSGALSIVPVTGALGTPTITWPDSTGQLANELTAQPVSTNFLLKQLNGTQANLVASSIKDDGTKVTISEPLFGANSTIVTTNLPISSTSFVTTGLVLPTLPVATTTRGRCAITWSQSTAPSTATFAVGLTNTVGDLWVQNPLAWNGTALAVQPSLVLATTTITAVTGALVPAAINTQYSVTFDFTLQTGGNLGILTIYAETGNASDALNIVSGSSCGWNP